MWPLRGYGKAIRRQQNGGWKGKRIEKKTNKWETKEKEPVEILSYSYRKLSEGRTRPGYMGIRVQKICYAQDMGFLNHSHYD